MTSKVVYLGDLSTELTHLKSKSVVNTDAPSDNKGKGQAFSPTDLLATSLASCMLTVIGIKAQERQISIEGSYANITKYMGTSPRRVVMIEVDVFLKGTLDAKEKAIFEKTAIACPVAKSLSPKIEQIIRFHY